MYFLHPTDKTQGRVLPRDVGAPRDEKNSGVGGSLGCEVLLRQKQATISGLVEDGCFRVTEAEVRRWGYMISPNGETKWK